jgi:hypothetical protein
MPAVAAELYRLLSEQVILGSVDRIRSREMSDSMSIVLITSGRADFRHSAYANSLVAGMRNGQLSIVHNKRRPMSCTRWA